MLMRHSQSTKAGVVVGRLRQNPDKNIQRVASEIVSKWRKNVDSAKDKRRKTEQGSQKVSLPTPKPISSPAPPSSSYNKPYEGDPEKRHFKVDKVDINRTGSKPRDGSIAVLYNALAYRATESIEEVVRLVVEVEAAAHKFYPEVGAYGKKIRSIMTSLKRKDNASLGRRVRSGEISPERLVKMTEQELSSEEQRARDQELERENMKKAQVPMAEKSISDALKCGKCGQKKVSYSQAQTRSADEPMTTFCECTVCGNRWKFS
ncbi:transcription factor S-II, central domain-containing protein [Podospora fimiseda]|uniref:Transcription factor S-II, central domain-containing protein n=1 Tax=Podospora fimiseda TaxID=252190 RepID=A0AAN7BWE3_9PEZI|nr:transcription factor S-II, central domain-containing protein [Podospora fimiseda]